MRKVITIILICVIISVSPVICHAKKDTIKEKPYMNIDVNGYADSEGRVIIRQSRIYANPQKEKIKIEDYISLYANRIVEFSYFKLVNYIIINKPDFIKVTEDANGNLKITGITNQDHCSVDIQLEYLLPLQYRSANESGEEFKNMFGLYYGSDMNSLPLKEYKVDFGFSQYAEEYDKSQISIRVPNGKTTNELIADKGTPINSHTPSISWYKKNVNYANGLFLDLSYRIPERNDSNTFWIWILIIPLMLLNIFLTFLFIRLRLRLKGEKSIENSK